MANDNVNVKHLPESAADSVRANASAAFAHEAHEAHSQASRSKTGSTFGAHTGEHGASSEASLSRTGSNLGAHNGDHAANSEASLSKTGSNLGAHSGDQLHVPKIKGFDDAHTGLASTEAGSAKSDKHAGVEKAPFKTLQGMGPVFDHKDGAANSTHLGEASKGLSPTADNFAHQDKSSGIDAPLKTLQGMGPVFDHKDGAANNLSHYPPVGESLKGFNTNLTLYGPTGPVAGKEFDAGRGQESAQTRSKLDAGISQGTFEIPNSHRGN